MPNYIITIHNNEFYYQVNFFRDRPSLFCFELWFITLSKCSIINVDIFFIWICFVSIGQHSCCVFHFLRATVTAHFMIMYNVLSFVKQYFIVKKWRWVSRSCEMHSRDIGLPGCIKCHFPMNCVYWMQVILNWYKGAYWNQFKIVIRFNRSDQGRIHN